MDFKLEISEQDRKELRRILQVSDQVTDEELLVLAQDLVLFPKLHNDKIKFMQKTVRLMPLPISKSKQINKAFSINQKKIGETISKAKGLVKSDGSIDQGKLIEILTADEGMDVSLAESVLECIHILTEFYKMEFAKKDIDDGCDLPTAIDFLEAQFRLQGENDFLLKPLVDTLKSMRKSEEVPTLNLLQNLLSSPQSVKPGI